MKKDRIVTAIIAGEQTKDGAGVLLTRILGYDVKELLDPFLLLDHFASDNPADYIAGFPWHPHRGIETITYMLAGSVRHGDSLGNRGIISEGDIQWMTAGSGIIHEEMPQKSSTGKIAGFQLWLNLPKTEKMCKPRYQEIKREAIPLYTPASGVSIKVIAGILDNMRGPVSGAAVDPLYLDITLAPSATHSFPVNPNHTVCAVLYEGNGRFGTVPSETIHPDHAVILSDGTTVTATAGPLGMRFLLLAGKPLKEPIAWGGPIVMNTREELENAFQEYQKGTFIK